MGVSEELSRDIENLDLYKVQKKDLDKVVEIITESFSCDPLIKYIIGGKIFNRIKGRHFFRLVIRLGIKYGYVYAPSSKLEGLIILFNNEHKSVSTLTYMLNGGISMPFKVFFSTSVKMLQYSHLQHLLENKTAPNPHWYVCLLGIDKNFQGKGYGSSLMKPFFRLFDKYKQDCYLETHNSKNVEIYKHYGFILKEKCKIFGSSLTHFSMLRAPKPI
jgi:ribosomal protein S18 acetylase RimI-like enzyme